MKKRLLSILLTLCMGIAMIPPMTITTNATGNSVYVGGTNVVAGSDITYWLNDASTGGIKSDGASESYYNVKYDPNSGGTPILTLNGVDITAAAQHRWSPYASFTAALHSEGALKIVLNGSNTLRGGFADGDDISCGLKSDGGLEITGTGTLTTTGGSYAYNSNFYSYGLYASSDITITDSNVTAVSGKAFEKSVAVYSSGNISIIGGNVSATSGEYIASVGVTCSYGIEAGPGKALNISSGAALTAKCSTSQTNSKAFSPGTTPNLGSYYSGYKITASTYFHGGSPETYNPSNISTYRYIRIEQCAATAAELAAALGSNATASDNAVTLTDDVADVDTSIHIEPSEDITLNLVGHSISGANGITPLKINGGTSTLTINGNGRILGGDADTAADAFSISGGTVVIENGSIIGGVSDYYSYGSCGDGIEITSGSLTIRGGAIKGGVSSNTYNYAGNGLMLQGGTVTIYDGSFYSGVDIFNYSRAILAYSGTVANIIPAGRMMKSYTDEDFTSGEATIANDTSLSALTAKYIKVEDAPPALVSAARTDDTHITVTLSESSTGITKANDGGFTVTETGALNPTYAVSSTEQGAEDASHVVLTVASMGKSAKEGVTVTYTAGGNGTIQDTNGNAMATNATGVSVAAWDTTAPAISSSTVAANNAYIDVVFSEGVYGAEDGTTPLTAAKLALTFTQNGGTATNAVISSVKKTDDTALTGGESTVRVFLTVTGTPNGLETIEMKPANGTSIYDLAGNAAAASQTSGVKTLTEKTNPTVSALSPADNATEIGVNQNLEIAFNKNVVIGTGNIVIKKTSDNSATETIDVTSGSITGVGTSIITIDPSVTLDSETEYCVQIDATAFKDEAGNYYAGIADTTSWSFTTADVTNPTVTALSPADNATDIDVNENLVINFSKNVVVGSGNIVIKRTSNNRVIETIDVTSGRVTGDGTSTITINPNVTLDNGTGYYVQIDPTAFEDNSGNSYAGITNTTSWSFTTYTTPTTTPTIESIVAFRADPDEGFGIDDQIAIFFDQNTNKPTIVADAVYGKLTLNNEHSWGSALNDEDFAWNTDGNILIITFSSITGTTIVVGDEITLDETANIKAHDGTTPASTASGIIDTDAVAPTISSSAVAADNAYMELIFSEGVYGSADGTTPLTPDELALTFMQNGGTAANVEISSVKKTDGTALTGGESTVRVFLTVTGTPNGQETIEIMPATDTSVYDWARNAAAASETSGAKTLNDLTSPLSTNADLSSLSLSGGTLSPVFDSDTTAYTANVPYATSSIRVTPTASENTATIKVNNISVASGQASGAIGLSVGNNTITIEVTAENTSVIRNYTLTVTRASAPTPTPDDDRDRSSDRTPAPSATTTPTPAPVIVIINGVEQGAATAEIKNVDGRIVNTIIIDDKKLEEKLKAEGNNSKLIVPIKGDSDIKAAQLNGQSVKNMEAKNSVLEIRTDNVTYTLPASQINIGKVSDSIGKQIELKDIKVSIQISSPSQDTIAIVENTASRNSYQVVVKPVEFNIICTSGNKTVEVSRFNGYVERMVAIPEGIDPVKITTGVVLNSDGSFSHVPTTIIVIDGKYYAKINSLTNSTYSVISTLKTFKDVEKHWAKNDINTMASRLIVDGIGNDKFDPDANITRGELADAVVRGLGLLRSGATTGKFIDVKPGHKYMSAIAIATEYGLIGGYVDNTYRPDNTITREEAMTILARAMKIAGMDASITDAEVKEILSVYKDASNVNNTAANGAALCTRYGVFTGNNNILAPKGNITKAETAAVIKRLLEKAKLI